MNYIITQEQLNTILKYMFTRPYGEVAHKINPDFISEEGKKNDTKK